MALRYDRRTGPDVRGAAGSAAGGSASGVRAGDVARALQRERLRQGLSLRDVSIRTGIPLVQLRASETGALHAHDQLAALKTVRRYADFLGLPGDRYALALLEHWPTRATPAWRPDPATAEEQATVAPPVTGSPTAVAAVAPRSAGDDTAGYAFYDTGVAPAVPAPYSQMSWRPSRRRPPVVLKVLVGVVTVAVAAALAALAVDRIKPNWIRSLGVTAANHPTAAAPAAPPVTHPVKHSGTVHSPSASTGHAPSATLRPAAVTAKSEVYRVGTSPFTLTLSAAGGRCWAEVTSTGAKAPLFEGVLDPGQSRTFTVDHSASVNLGSSAGRLSVTAGSRHELTDAKPPKAPYTVTFTASR